jgi:iron complex transport system ATP-binding protein
MADGAPALAAEGLGFFYRPGEWVFRDLSFEVRKAGILAVLGQNGCGKTTLLRLLLGTLRPAAGRVERAGEASLVPQLFQAAFSFTALDMVLMGRARHIGVFSRPSRRDEAAAMESMSRLGIGDLADRPFPELSGGQRQLVMLARALASEAGILVLDEPASSLDLGNQAMLLGQLRRLSRGDGLTIVFSTHLPQHALAAADDVLAMDGGGRDLFGPAAEVLTGPNLSRLYGTPIKRVTVEHEGAETEALVTVFKEP